LCPREVPPYRPLIRGCLTVNGIQFLCPDVAFFAQGEAEVGSAAFDPRATRGDAPTRIGRFRNLNTRRGDIRREPGRLYAVHSGNTQLWLTVMTFFAAPCRELLDKLG